MAGRGRGRGATFNALADGLGLPRQQFDPAVSSADPPAIYPPLGGRPPRPQETPEHDYMLAVMKDFVNQMRDSQFSITASSSPSASKNILAGRHSDKVQVIKVGHRHV